MCDSLSPPQGEAGDPGVRGESGAAGRVVGVCLHSSSYMPLIFTVQAHTHTHTPCSG